jgi:hypothetical protein
LVEVLINSSSGTRNKVQVSGITLRKKLQRITLEEMHQVDRDVETQRKDNSKDINKDYSSKANYSFE